MLLLTEALRLPSFGLPQKVHGPQQPQEARQESHVRGTDADQKEDERRPGD